MNIHPLNGQNHLSGKDTSNNRYSISNGHDMMSKHTWGSFSKSAKEPGEDLHLNRLGHYACIPATNHVPSRKHFLQYYNTTLWTVTTLYILKAWT